MLPEDKIDKNHDLNHVEHTRIDVPSLSLQFDHTPTLVLLGLVLLLCAFGSATAEPVAINRATAQGYVFNHAGNCYAVFPDHAKQGRSRKITLATAAPVATGEGSMLDFSSNHDLAIAYVGPGFEAKCQDSWVLFKQPVQSILTQNATGYMIRIFANGQFQRVDVRVKNFNLDKIFAETVGNTPIQQGSSGSFLVLNDRLAGMLLSTTDGKSAEFLRIDAIHAQISRLVDTGVTVQAPDAPTQPAACPKTQVSFRSIICDREPVSPDFPCSNLVHGKPLLIPAASLPVTVYAELNLERPRPVSRIALRSITSDPNGAGAKSVSVMVDSSSDPNAPYWRYFGAADMPPTGNIDLLNGSQPYARRIKVIIGSGWSGNKPVNLNCLSVL